MLPADAMAALVPWLTDDLLNGLAEGARDAERRRPLNGLPPWPIEAQTVARYLDAEQRSRLRGLIAVKPGPEIGPEISDAAVLACWLTTESAASVLRVGRRHVSKALPSSAARELRDLEDRRRRFLMWDPLVVGTERLRREERHDKKVAASTAASRRSGMS